MNTFKKLSTKPTWLISIGAILLIISYIIGDDIVWWLVRIFQVIGIALFIFGIIVASAKLNSERRP